MGVISQYIERPKLYEVLVPSKDNSGEKFPLVKHYLWDERVISIVGGLTLYSTVSGKWQSSKKEKSILVRIETLYIVKSATFLHDTLEDCRVSYGDLKSKFGTRIADIVYAVTNEKGKTRKERANAKYYKGIRDTEFAVFVKLCDRIANVEAGGKVDMYRKEQAEFEEGLNGGPMGAIANGLELVKYFPMIEYLRELLNG